MGIFSLPTNNRNINFPLHLQCPFCRKHQHSVSDWYPGLVQRYSTVRHLLHNFDATGPLRWPVGLFQLSFPPWLKLLVTPLLKSEWHCELDIPVLQPPRWCCVDYVILHERDVREEQHHTYMWREQAIIEWSWHVNSIVACCHSAKLCAYVTRDFRSQHRLVYIEEDYIYIWGDLNIMTYVDKTLKEVYWEGIFQKIAKSESTCSTEKNLIALRHYQYLWKMQNH